MPITKNEEETKKIAAEVGKNLVKKKILYLTGDLGSGKTTFTKGLAEYFGIDHFSIKSPTYTYIRKHNTNTNTNTNTNFYHIDLYRVEAVDELLLNELYELMENKNNILVIEWADRLPKAPYKGIKINFEYIDGTTRKITINE